MTPADAKLMRAFRSCDLPALSHHEHVRLAWIVLQDQSLLTAIQSLRVGFRRFAQTKGKPELFHETITWAFTVLINEHIERGPAAADSTEFVAMNPDLCRGLIVLEDYYLSTTLHSDLARRTFVLPDRALASIPEAP